MLSSQEDDIRKKGAQCAQTRHLIESGGLIVGRHLYPHDAQWLPMLKVGFGLQLDSGDHVLAGRRNRKCLKCLGGPGRVRTVDLFHAMEARSQLRHRPVRTDFCPENITGRSTTNSERISTIKVPPVLMCKPIDWHSEEAHNQTVGKNAPGWVLHSVWRTLSPMSQTFPQIGVPRQEASLSRDVRAAQSADPVMHELAHELRQPLGVIESLAYYLELISTDEKVCGHLQRIQAMVFEANRILEHASTSPCPVALEPVAC